MHREVQGGNTLLISGPASAAVTSGKVAVLGMELAEGDKIIVRRGKSIPFEAEVNSVLDIVLGAEASVHEEAGSTIPDSWREGVEEIISQEKPCTVMVLGDVDSGKTTFSTFLINKTLASEFKPVIIDVDLGQSNIGPPTSISLGFISEPLADLFSAKPTAIFFTGLTSPNGITKRVVSGLEAIRKRVSEGMMDLTVINTDGWVVGDEAVYYKTELITRVCPDLVAGIQRSDELEPILRTIEEMGLKAIRLSTSPALRRRDREERRELRGQSYKKFLGDLALRNLPMNWVQFEYTTLGSGNILDSNGFENLEKIIGRRIVYCEDGSEELFIVIDKEDEVDKEKVSAAERLFQKNLCIVKDGEEKGLLVGLLNRNRDFLGLGIISKVDYRNKTLKIQTSCRDEISIVQFGQVKIDESGRELGITTSFSTKDQTLR